MPADEQAALAPWTDALRHAWDQRRTDARWLRDTLSAGLLVAREAEMARVPEKERIVALEHIAHGRLRAHLGWLSDPQEAGSLRVTRRLDITLRPRGQKTPQTRWIDPGDPEEVTPPLAAKLRALASAERYLEAQRPGWRKHMQDSHQVSHLSFVRRRVDRRVIEVWLVPFASTPGRVVLGGDYLLTLDTRGAQVKTFTALHPGMTLIKVDRATHAGNTESIPQVRNHLHQGREGDLPSATDLLKIATSPNLRGLAVIGRRHAMLVGLSSSGLDWEGILYHSHLFQKQIWRPER